MEAGRWWDIGEVAGVEGKSRLEGSEGGVRVTGGEDTWGPGRITGSPGGITGMLKGGPGLREEAGKGGEGKKGRTPGREVVRVVGQPKWRTRIGGDTGKEG